MNHAYSIACAVVALTAGAAGASAQDVAAPAAPAETGDEHDILVTAQRREESVQRSAAAIAALPGAALDERGIDSVVMLQNVVPSVHIGSFGGATNISIRGVGASIGGTGVAVNIDGVYQTQGTTPDLAQFDLERIEVLRGPQGTLYGRNATGGAVNVLTRAPTGELEGWLLAGFAEYDEYHLQGLVNLPIANGLRARLLVDYRDRRDGFIRNVDPAGQDLDYGHTFSARFRLAADITPDLTFDLNASTMRNEGPIVYITYTSQPEPIAFLLNPFLANATFLNAPLRTNANNPSSGERDYDIVSGTFTWETPFATFKSITAWQRYFISYVGDGDGTNLTIAPYGGSLEDRTFTQEVDINGTAGRLDWVVGAFLMRERNATELHYLFTMGLTGLPPGSYFDFLQPRYDTNSYAAFADLTYNIGDNLRLIAGARYSEDHQTTRYGAAFGLQVGDMRIPLGDICPAQTYRLRFNSFTPRAGIQYDIDADRTAYFVYSRGFKAGGANTFGCNDDFRPEHINSYELGFRSRFLDDKLTLNAWVFHYDYSDFQVAQVVGLALDITNAAAARVNGLELETAWTPDEHWTLRATFSWLDATYSSFENVDGLNPALGVQDLSGNPLNNTPRTSVNVGIGYRSDPMSWGRVIALVDASYRSRVYFREFNLRADSQDPVGLVNLNLIWESPGARFSVRAYATNLTNESYTQSLTTSSSFGARIATWARPRQIGAELKVRF